jgi:soluble lytic murein transglycosylase
VSPGASAAGTAAPAPETALGSAARLAFDGNVTDAIAALRPLVDGPATPETVRVRARFLLGVFLLRTGRPAEAGPALEAAVANPLLAEYALFRLAQARRAAGDPAGAAQSLARLVGQYPKSPLADAAWRERGRAAAEAGDLASAESALREALARNRGDAAKAELRLLLAEVLLRAGRPSEAISLLRDLWLTIPAAREADRALEILATLPAPGPGGASPAAFTEAERFQRAMRLFRGGAYGKAARELTPFAEGGGPNTTQARQALGVSRFFTREYGEAIRTLEPLLKDSARDGRAEALFWVARSHGRLGDRAQFIAWLEELLASAPQHRRADEALFFLANGYIWDRRRDRAGQSLERLLRDYPRSDRFEAALWGRGWLWYQDGQYQQAAAAFQKLAARAPGWWAQATYWKGRAREAAGRKAEARRLYGEVARRHDAYYRSLARARLGGDAPPTPGLAAAAAPAPGPPADQARLAVARALASLWLAEEAGDEYWNLVREHPEDRGLVAEAAGALLRLERIDRAVGIAKRVLWPQYVQSGGTPPIPGFWELLYPRGYWGLVTAEGAARRLDPYLVLALIREESAFAPQALSPAGARGLMQLRPATAARVASAHGLSPPGKDGPALEEPWYNIRLGSAELAALLDEFKGNLVLALAAYNSGPHNVQRWLLERGYLGPEEFVEEIPFDETRNYVKRVLGSYERYRQLHAAGPSGPEPGRQDQGLGTRDSGLGTRTRE